MTYRECYRIGSTDLQKAGVPDWETDARYLLEFVCGTDRNTLLAHGDMPVLKKMQEQYFNLIEKRKKRIPLQLLTGKQNFCGLDFIVNEHVLIPRGDTEILVEAALKIIKPGMRILDMCTGSGCILISILAMTEGVRGTGADSSGEALRVAGENGRWLLQKDKRPDWILSDLFSAFLQNRDKGSEEQFCKYDMIVSNPPYISSDVIDTLMPEVRDFEPRQALDGSDDGLMFYRKIIKESIWFLNENGYLLFEIGYDQGRAVSEMMEAAGFADIKVIKDYAGLDRVVTGRINEVKDV